MDYSMPTQHDDALSVIYLELKKKKKLELKNK
jgi:hypothetical protein